jgi:8-oxo-dGTP pyrophosphatase MutT (NUDIX family)
MAKLLHGDRIGETGQILVGCSAVIFNSTGEEVLLTRRTDNGKWCLPGGRMEPGESAAEACAREVWEETGLQVKIERLIGIYTSPHRIVTYSDGNRWQIVALNFEAKVTRGELQLSDETTDFGYFSRDAIERLDLMEHHQERIDDAFATQSAAFVR